ncbi:MAG: UvrD-helicase domain-containing protein [Lachnospiraceae bacterium]|nr:UvrD-helicase domain-containing protein [Lachnospiraceae bacterium]
MNLNKEQYRAAVHINGPMLVLAGPGSGKTHLLVERIRMMIEDAHIRPESILVITFSRNAARQMQARFCKRVEEKVYPVTFGTFHAVFYYILQEYDPNTNRLRNS